MTEERVLAQLMAEIKSLNEGMNKNNEELKKNNEDIKTELRHNNENMTEELHKNSEDNLMTVNKKAKETSEQFKQFSEGVNKTIGAVTKEFYNKVAEVKDELQIVKTAQKTVGKRMNTMEKWLKKVSENRSSVTSCPLNSEFSYQAAVKLKPGHFNGKTSWEEYQT